MTFLGLFYNPPVTIFFGAYFLSEQYYALVYNKKKLGIP